MSSTNTNSNSNSIITEIKAKKYIQHTAGNLAQHNQAELALVKNDFYKTGKDTYNLTVHGKTELDYGYRSRTSNGNVEENAEGNLTEKCSLSSARIFLGMRQSAKIGPTFFTKTLTDGRIDIGANLSVSTVGIGLGVLRSIFSIGASASAVGVQFIAGMTSVEDVQIKTEQASFCRQNPKKVDEEPYYQTADDMRRARAEWASNLRMKQVGIMQGPSVHMLVSNYLATSLKTALTMAEREELKAKSYKPPIFLTRAAAIKFLEDPSSLANFDESDYAEANSKEKGIYASAYAVA